MLKEICAPVGKATEYVAIHKLWETIDDFDLFF
jgi:hypothetical protein